jgi:hypothetical protein
MGTAQDNGEMPDGAVRLIEMTQGRGEMLLAIRAAHLAVRKVQPYSTQAGPEADSFERELVEFLHRLEQVAGRVVVA